MGGYSNTVGGVQMHDAGGIVPDLVDGAMDGKTRGIDIEVVGVDLVGVLIHSHQAGGCNFLEHHTVWINKKVVLVTGYPCGNMGKYQIVPAVQGDQTIGRGEVDSELPFFLADLISF